MGRNSLDTLNDIAQVIYDKKGSNILALDVRGISSITDYILIAEGNVDRHVSSIGKSIVEELKQKGETPVHTEGLQSGDWAVIDYCEVMVHIFMPGLREKYSLERLWGDSKIVDLNISITNPAMGEKG
ncbi:MAG: ribosome silencing factor [Verrucomicrobia bacterium]|nr:ribosome silencing factor [Verrucomicrobiota bacterium]